MLLLVLYVSLALGVSFLCSILEAVLLSVTPTFIATEQRAGTKAGERLAKMKKDIDRPLAAILSLNTVAHTVGAAGAGAQALEVFGNAYVTAVSVVLTLLILVVSEIIPKTLGAVYWKQFAGPVAAVLPALIILTYPLVLLSKAFSSMVAGPKHGPTLDRAEFSALARVVRDEGIIDEKESRVLENLLRFNSLVGGDVMTPRTVITAFDENKTVSEVAEDKGALRFSRYPVFDGDIDKVTGVVLKHDVMLAVANDQHDLKLSELRRNILTLPAEMAVPELLDRMLGQKLHIALLIGPYGGTAGVVTIEDIIETLMGIEIVDETDAVANMQTLARERWLSRARKSGLILDDQPDPLDSAKSSPEVA